MNRKSADVITFGALTALVLLLGIEFGFLVVSCLHQK